MKGIDYRLLAKAMLNPNSKPPQPPPWEQPKKIENENLQSLPKETITVEKKVFDALQKNNLDLMANLETAKEALEVIATHTVFPDAPEDLVQQIQTVYNIAEGTLKEIEK